ncbi:Bicoid-interacting protein 3-domain-containing protein, partial [Syncephalis pseudoplumigaleata]
DPRVQVMDAAWFEGQQVLDIGCNAGYVTVEIARRYTPRRIVGVDIDEVLVAQAWRHLRHRWSLQRPASDEHAGATIARSWPCFPLAMPALFGALPWPAPSTTTTSDEAARFPMNIDFWAGDWLGMPPEPHTYDTILALSITKWIHLHKGDDGMRHFFYRVHACLRAGGRFILEPQPWRSYTRKSKLTPAMRQTYASITFKPDAFEAFLLDKVGFDRVEERAVP